MTRGEKGGHGYIKRQRQREKDFTEIRVEQVHINKFLLLLVVGVVESGFLTLLDQLLLRFRGAEEVARLVVVDWAHQRQRPQ